MEMEKQRENIPISNDNCDTINVDVSRISENSTNGERNDLIDASDAELSDNNNKKISDANKKINICAKNGETDNSEISDINYTATSDANNTGITDRNNRNAETDNAEIRDKNNINAENNIEISDFSETASVTSPSQVDSIVYNSLRHLSFEEGMENESDSEIAPRALLWQNAFDIYCSDGSQFDSFDDIFDLPEQMTLREDCGNFVAKLGNNDEEKISVLSDLESILTCHCKANNLTYRNEDGWIDIMLPLLTLKLPRCSTYDLFQAILNSYIPKNADAYHLFRLLLQYHDPEICNYFDTKKLLPEMYAKSWFQTLFSSSCNLQATLSLWDLYFQKRDPFFLFFLALVLVSNARDALLMMKGEPKDTLIEAISILPSNLCENDMTDFCALAQYYDSKTPNSFKQDYYEKIFGDDSFGRSGLSQFLCLPVSVFEVMSRTELKTDDSKDKVAFFLIDCRPAEQYNAGHLRTAFHLDCNLMLQDPSSFETAIEGLLSCQKQALKVGSQAGGEHLCFMGCGDMNTDQFTHMVVASFLKKHTQYVSMMDGGYEAYHGYIGSNVTDFIADHDPQLCRACNCQLPATEASPSHQKAFSSKGRKTSTDIFDKIGLIMKTTTAEVKDKLKVILANKEESQRSANVASREEAKMSCDVPSKHRNVQQMFTIDDEQEIIAENVVDARNTDETQLASVSTWKKKFETLQTVKCQEVKQNNVTADCYLLITKDSLIVLTADDSSDELFELTAKRCLSSVLHIRCRKKWPEFVTFQYGTFDPTTKQTSIVDVDRFLIPNVKQVTEFILSLVVEKTGTKVR